MVAFASMSKPERPNPSQSVALTRPPASAEHLIPVVGAGIARGNELATGPAQVQVAETVEQVMLTCRHDDPLQADDVRYQDLTRGRGDRSAEKLLWRLQRKQAGISEHLLFASHRGAGKTTELHRLTQSLEARYASLYIEANVAMDSHRIEIEDVLLILARRIEQWLRERGTPIDAGLLKQVESWFFEAIGTTSWGKDWSVDVASGLKVEAGLPLLAKLLASITSLIKVESKHREEVKAVFKKFPGTLLESVNALLDAAKDILAKENQELLIIIDNLDRYDPEVIDKLLLGNGDRIRALRCNLILTPPISLIYQPHSEPLSSYFPCQVMNTVRLRRPEQPYPAFDGSGRDVLLDALRLRINLSTLMPDSAVQDRLVMASGGGIRELLSLLSDACFYAAESNRFSLDAIEKAIQERKALMRDTINSEGLAPTLARIARDKQLFEEPRCRRVLYLRYVFKYNGDGWYDIHPLIDELPEFQRAFQQLSLVT